MAAMMIVASYAQSSACAYCYHNDINSGIGVSYSYCEFLDVCLKNAWNYIKRDCPSGWLKGKDLDLFNQCKPTKSACPSFVSNTTTFYQKWDNQSWSLPAGTFCEISVDAREAVGRIQFGGDKRSLGIFQPSDVLVDDITTFQEGVQDVIVFNANESGPVFF